MLRSNQMVKVGKEKETRATHGRKGLAKRVRQLPSPHILTVHSAGDAFSLVRP